MIKNERQYRITRSQAEKFDAAITQLEAAPAREGIHPKLQKAEIDGLRSQLDDLLSELKAYEALKAGRRQTLPLESFDELPDALIQARIASGLSQEEFAGRLGLKPQQVQRYEATNRLLCKPS